jgi:hypothetical protein
VVYKGEEPGGERFAVWTAGSETGVQRRIPSVVQRSEIPLGKPLDNTGNQTVYTARTQAPWGSE